MLVSPIHELIQFEFTISNQDPEVHNIGSVVLFTTRRNKLVTTYSSHNGNYPLKTNVDWPFTVYNNITCITEIPLNKAPIVHTRDQ